ncbi:MAG: C69 family dipeptidase [Mogibacterium sp.]|nr:C69 family dipeptidase [Mogibacterium sp.]
MSCTTVLVGKRASNDNTTMISRTDDGHFDVKKTIVVEPEKQPRKYKSKIAHLEIELPDDPMRYTGCPSVDNKNGVWATTGINEAGVGMSATETLTSNPRVLSADPLVEYKPAKGRQKAVPGGLGEEDFVVVVLPYIHSAREGVVRLGSLLEKYGTYEINGIAFNDENEIWWLDTIGGHHWIATKVPDDRVVINPNQFGTDSFDLDDAFGKQESHMCSADLREFIRDYNLDCGRNGEFDPRKIFGSRRDMDHVYNTPRAWFIGRYLAPVSHSWDGPDAEFHPESDDLPWSLVPDRKVTIEDVQYLLSAHFQGTPWDPYGRRELGLSGKYRSIGINRTGVTHINQIRSNVPDEIKGVEWICYGCTTFSCWVPVYTNVASMPDYISKVTLDVSTDNLFWASRLIGAMADKDYDHCIQDIERYQDAVNIRARQIIIEYDKKMIETGDYSLAEEANKRICEMAKEETTKALGRILQTSSVRMKNNSKLSDN